MTFATTDTLNWNVGTRDLFYTVAGEEIKVPGKVAQVRTDTRECVGITSPSYEVFQNHSLKDLVYPLVDAGQLTIENMGYLGKGEKVFIQCAMADEYKMGNESFKGMITLLNSHNASSKLSAGVTTERVICSNTFAMAQQDMSTKLAHRADIHSRALEITEVIKAYINDRSIQVNILPRGLTWLDTGTHESMMQASQYVHAVEERSGVKIACLEEIALNKGWVTKSDVKMIADSMGSGSYSKYLRQISNEDF